MRLWKKVRPYSYVHGWVVWVQLRAYLSLAPKPSAEGTARGSHCRGFTQIPFSSLRDGFSPQMPLFKVIRFWVLTVPDCQIEGWEAVAPAARSVSPALPWLLHEEIQSGFAQLWPHYTQSPCSFGVSFGLNADRRKLLFRTVFQRVKKLETVPWLGWRKYKGFIWWRRTGRRTGQDGSLQYLKSCHKWDWNSFLRLRRAESEPTGSSHRAELRTVWTAWN